MFEESWNCDGDFPFLDAGTSVGTGMQEAEMDWVVKYLVCLGMGYAVAACAQPGSCVLCYLLRENSLPGACECLSQALLVSLPRLVDKGPSPTSVIRSYVDFQDRTS
jgi:hypothetical protein